MTLFRQLYDPHTGVYYSIDAKKFIFKMDSDEVKKEIRIKPHFAAILLAMFTQHPEPLSYKIIENILREFGLLCPDETRLHRKMSELRAQIIKIHPNLSKLITNIRAVGYNLPLHLQEPNITDADEKYNVTNPKLLNIISYFEVYLETSVGFSKECEIIKEDYGYILCRKPVHEALEELLSHCTKIQNDLLNELKLHPADFISLRLELCFAKLRTYLGLARVSEFSISKNQWIEWHEHESQRVLEEMVALIKQSEQ